MAASRARISREILVDTAVNILGREGRDFLTARRIATALGVSPMALYRHVSDMDALLDLSLDRILEGLTTPPASEGWGAVTELFSELRRRLLSHPGVVNVLMDRPTYVPNGFVAMDSVLTQFSSLGLSRETAVRTLDSLLLFTLASVRWQLARTGGERAMSANAARANPGQLQALAEHADAISDRDPDDYFKFGIEALIAGVNTAH